MLQTNYLYVTLTLVFCLSLITWCLGGYLLFFAPGLSFWFLDIFEIMNTNIPSLRLPSAVSRGLKDGRICSVFFPGTSKAEPYAISHDH